MSSKKLKGYWGNVRDRMAQRLADNHGLAALVVRHSGYNRNAQGLSFRVEGGDLPLIIMEPRLAEQHAARITNKKNRPRSDGSIWSFAYLTNKRT
ncbi:hypothetical protein ACBZ90_17890 (plasmid) [Vibrio alginolyticus]